MAALNIGCSDREPVTVYNPTVRYRTPLEIAYREAQDEADHKWKSYTMMVDLWIANKDYEKMDAEEELCKLADLKAHVLYKQMYCNHPETVEFDDHVECTECGRKLLSGKRIV